MIDWINKFCKNLIWCFRFILNNNNKKIQEMFTYKKLELRKFMNNWKRICLESLIFGQQLPDLLS